jgi:hypothetical protein
MTAQIDECARAVAGPGVTVEAMNPAATEALQRVL